MPLLAAVLLLACAGLLRADDLPGLHGPLRTVMENYLVIQQQLATDSFTGVPAAATAMQAAITSAPAQSFAPDMVQAVQVLANAKDLHAARLAFSTVSDCLIAALARNQIQTGSLHAVFCPMRKAYWLQTDGRAIHNPYYGTAMPDCGEFQQQY